jgi:RimJ/RimL family protein N-acetyltransferase
MSTPEKDNPYESLPSMVDHFAVAEARPIDPEDRIILVDDLDTVSLRQLVMDDADRYFELVELSRDHLSQHGDHTAAKYQTLEDTRRSMLQLPGSKRYRFGIWDGEVMVGTNNMSIWGKDRAEFGTWIGEPYIGNEYAGRARRLLVKFAFEELGLTMVYCDIKTTNHSSQRSVQKSGFIFAGEHEDERGNEYWRYKFVNPNV